jgi:hypothetical protein
VGGKTSQIYATFDNLRNKNETALNLLPKNEWFSKPPPDRQGNEETATARNLLPPPEEGLTVAVLWQYK